MVIFPAVLGVFSKMDEVKDILKDCLEKIERIADDSSTSAGQTSERAVAASSNQSFVQRAEANFRAAFPQLRSSNGQQPKKRKKGPSFVPIVIKDTWTHEFIVLNSPSTEKTPSLGMSQTLILAGLGKKKIVFPDKHGDHSKLRAKLEEEYPKLSSQNGAFDLLRADRGGPSRALIPIPMEQKGGYSIPYLKEMVSSSAAIYIRPMQSKLDLERASQSSSSHDQVKTECVSCGTKIPIQNLKEHQETCSGGCSTRQTSVLACDLHSADNKTDKDSSTWLDHLSEMFPLSPKDKIASAVQQAKTLDEAAEHVCETLEEQEAPSTVIEKTEEKLYFSSVESVVDSLMLNISNSDYNLTVDREEVCRGALIFYKKALTKHDILWNNLSISFKGEDGLDGGAIKADFFEMLLKEVQERLFEGSEWSMLPVKDSTKGLLFQLAGTIVGHSIIQGGPSFSALCPAVYYYLAAADPVLVLSSLRRDNIPLNAGTAVLHEMLDNLQKENVSTVLNVHPSKDCFWAVINASHWPIAKEITDQNLALLVQNVLESGIILSRKFEIDSFSDGLKMLGLLDIIKNNKEVCYKLLCPSLEQTLTPNGFLSLLDNKVEKPKDFAKQRCYDWFIEYINSAEEQRLRCLLQFTTGFRSIPPRGLPQKIVVKFLPEDDETGSLPRATACLSILQLPTIHSSEKKFKESLDVP